MHQDAFTSTYRLVALTVQANSIQREKEIMVEVDRLCDDQAVFLIEVLSQYRARRAAKVLSPRFGTLYRKVRSA
jgi:hypothetical protein